MNDSASFHFADVALVPAGEFAVELYIELTTNLPVDDSRHTVPNCAVAGVVVARPVTDLHLNVIVYGVEGVDLTTHRSLLLVDAFPLRYSAPGVSMKSDDVG